MPAELTFKLLGAGELIEDFRRLDSAAQEKIRDAIASAAFVIEREAKFRAPVDTGRLRASIHADVENVYGDEPNATVSDGVEYGVFNEFGTSSRRGTPFFRPAIREGELYLERRLVLISEELEKV